MGNVTIKIQVGSLLVEVTGPKDYAEKKAEELIKKHQSLSTIETPGLQLPQQKKIQGKSLSPSEFIKKISPKNQSEKALALGYYFEKYQQKANFSTADISELCQKAKQSKFTNISDTVSNLVKQGFIMGAGETEENKRIYTLTTSGEEFIEKISNI